MFTGIIKNIGYLNCIIKRKNIIYIYINYKKYFIKKTKIGDSISINGSCLTIIKKTNNGLWFNISKETIKKTTNINKIGPINIEKSLNFKKYIGGSLTTGHIDLKGKIIYLKYINNNLIIKIKIKNKYKKYFTYKGSIIINGTSLTINKINYYKKYFKIYLNIISYTIKNTTFKYLNENSKINIEIDLIIKYINYINKIYERKTI